LYLATVIDCHTKAVVGYATDDNYKTPLIEDAIRMAARNYPLKYDADLPLRPRQQQPQAQPVDATPRPGGGSWGESQVGPR